MVQILSLNPQVKKSSNSQDNPGTIDENKVSKVCTIKILLDSGVSASIIHKDFLHECHKFLKMKRINSLLWQVPLILVS